MSSANATRAAHIAATTNILHYADAAAQINWGERVAGDFRNRMSAGIPHPDELAVIIVYLHGELLHRFCRLVQKVLEVWHG